MYFKSIERSLTSLGTSTAGVTDSAQLVSGTAVQVAGAGLNLTAPPSYRKLIVRMITPSVPREGKRAVVARGRKHKKTVELPHPVPEIAAFIQRRAIACEHSGEVQVARISTVASSKALPAALKVFGKPGAAPRPAAKSYDVDLDDYQD